MKKINYILVFLVAFGLLNCKSDKIEPSEKLFGEYYPLVSGNYVVYNAKRIVYTNTVPDTINFQLKEVNKGEFSDKEGNTNYRIERLIRNSDSEGWKIDSVWYLIDKKDKLVKVESNTPYIRMVYPINKGTEWNVNAMNNNQYNCGGFNCKLDDIANYIDIAKPQTIGAKFFEKTVTVNQKGYVTETDSIRFRHIYAANIGRVYSLNINLALCKNYDVLNPEKGLCKFKQIIDGYIYEETYLEHGTED
jgi:hypothetical protein